MQPIVIKKKNEAFSVDTRIAKGFSIAETESGYGLYSSVSCRNAADAEKAWNSLPEGEEAPEGWAKFCPEDILPKQQVDAEVVSSRYFWLKNLDDETYTVRF